MILFLTASFSRIKLYTLEEGFTQCNLLAC